MSAEELLSPTLPCLLVLGVGLMVGDMLPEMRTG